MTTPSTTTPTGATNRFAAWAAIASGVSGLLALGFLIAYLTTQADEFIKSEVMPPMGRFLITSNYVGVMLQALFMIPAAVALHKIGRQRSKGLSRAAVTVGVIALCSVALLRLLLVVNPAVSDILFMGPTGFIGVWLIVVNWLLAGVLSRALRITGTIAGIGLIIVGASFFFLGGLAVLTDGPFAYTSNVNFHIGIAVGGLPGFILYPIWAILLGRKLFQAQRSSSKSE